MYEMVRFRYRISSNIGVNQERSSVHIFYVNNSDLRDIVYLPSPRYLFYKLCMVVSERAVGLSHNLFSPEGHTYK